MSKESSDESLPNDTERSKSCSTDGTEEIKYDIDISKLASCDRFMKEDIRKLAKFVKKNEV